MQLPDPASHPSNALPALQILRVEDDKHVPKIFLHLPSRPGTASAATVPRNEWKDVADLDLAAGLPLVLRRPQGPHGKTPRINLRRERSDTGTTLPLRLPLKEA